MNLIPRYATACIDAKLPPQSLAHAVNHSENIVYTHTAHHNEGMWHSEKNPAWHYYLGSEMREHVRLWLFDSSFQDHNVSWQAHVCKHLQSEAKGCDILVLWLDCDREGENICFEVSSNLASATLAS